MHPRALVAVTLIVAAALPACRRDLDLPARNTLAFVDAFPAAAPREALGLAVAGGAPPYAFSFAGGAAASGPDAVLDPGSGAYVAGSLGPAIDVVLVRDATGATREARIAVGPPLQVVPASAFVAPGGKAGFVPSGGKPPYVLEILGGGAGAVQGTNYVAPASGGCGGAVSAPTTVALRLRDATAAAPVALAVTVGRGLDLFPAAGTGEVAPHEQIAFVASGGQPPYEFSMAPGPVPSGGPGIDPGRGTYVAGDTGDVVDAVIVTDANGERRCFDVAVGPRLSVTLSTLSIRPGKPVSLVASGGRPPYQFSFAPKGNRSRGTVGAVTGVYVPGLNALATDLVVVRDSTSAPPVGPISLPVGPLQLPTGESGGGCAAGDVDGDGHAELLTFPLLNGTATATRWREGELPAAATYAVGRAPLAMPVVRDLDGDGRADVAFPDDTGRISILFGSASGALRPGPSVEATATRIAAAREGTPRLFAQGRCGGVNGIVYVDFVVATGTLSAPTCVASGFRPLHLAAGDFDGDGLPDVAYIHPSFADRVLVRYGAGGYAGDVHLVLPAPWLVDRLPSTVVRRMIEVRPAGAAYSDLAVAVMDAAATEAYRTGVAGFAGGAGGLAYRWSTLLQPGGEFNLLGLAALGGATPAAARVAAWNGADGSVASLDWSSTFTPAALSSTQVAMRDFRVGCVAAGDLDGDGHEDLLVGPRDAGPEGDALLGTGDGRHGVRPRFAFAGLPAGDVDGDGLPDFIGRSPSLNLEVLFVTDRQVAVGPETPVAGQFLAAQAGDWDGDRIPDVMARIGSTGLSFFRGTPARDGHFEPALAVTATDPLGAPFALTSASLARANFGGGSTGPDLLALARVGSKFHPAAVVLSGPRSATVGVAPQPASYMTPADLDGDGVQDLVASDGGASLRAALVKPTDPVGAGWPFRGWVDLPSPPDFFLFAGAVPVPAPAPPRERAVVVSTDRILLVGFAAGAPAIEDTVLLGSPILVDQTLAAVGDVTGDGLPDLVVAQSAPSPWYVFAGDAAGSFAPTPARVLDPGGTTFNLVPGPTGAMDLLLDVPGGVVLLGNDGTGTFR